MAYQNKNFLKKREAAVRLANLHYEPGRQDRNYKWVWRKYIYPTYNIEYDTFMRWRRAEKEKEPPRHFQQSLF